MADLAKIVEDLSKLTVLEVAELVQAARREVGRVSAAAPSPWPAGRRWRRRRRRG